MAIADNYPSRNVWADAKENANNYYNDDILQRVATLWVMALLTLYGNNANSVGEDLGKLGGSSDATKVLC